MAKSKATIRLKRAYEAPSKEDGQRILVERLWPRGLTKEKAAIDYWAKEIAPSSKLRQWYGHELSKWAEFQKRYRAELDQHGDLIEGLRQRIGSGPVTFVYAAKDEEHNSALLLKHYLDGS
jgi:uncharacterized protein YeaO (DUF488 family)